MNATMLKIHVSGFQLEKVFHANSVENPHVIICKNKWVGNLTPFRDFEHSQ